MKGEVVQLDSKRRASELPVSDFWFAQLEVRLGRIETLVSRIEKQIWLIVCTALILSLAHLVRAFLN